MRLYPWQQHVLERTLGERDDGKWAAFEACLIVPRQNGKTFLLLARVLAGLLLFDERLILWSSQLDSTNLESFRALKQVIEDNDFLRLRIKAIRETNGQVTVEFKGGQRVRFVCRSSHSGRGFTADCVIFDEAYKLDPSIMGALTPTLLNRPNPQMWYTSSAPRSESAQLWTVRRRGIDGVDAGRLAFLEWSVDPDGFDVDSPESWAVANPTLGIGELTVENLRSVHDSMPVQEFLREICGVPDPEPSTVGDSALDPVAWTECRDDGSVPADQIRWGVEISRDRHWCAIGVGGRRADGLGHVSLVEYRRMGRWVIPRLKELISSRPGMLFLAPEAGAQTLIPDLEAEEIAFEALSGRQVQAACARFRDMVDERLVRYVADDPLDVAAVSASSRMVGDGFVWDRRRGGDDIAPLFAVTLAAWPQGEQAPLPAIY